MKSDLMYMYLMAMMSFNNTLNNNVDCFHEKV